MARARDAPLRRRGAGDPAVRAGRVRAPFGGPHCTYVGHPLAERIGELRPEAGDTRRNSDPPVVLVLPGSRGSEIRRLADIFGAAIAKAAERAGPFDLVLPTLPHIAGAGRAATADWPVRPRIVIDAAENTPLSQRARGTRGLRHGDAGARARAGADGRGLSHSGLGGRPVPHAGQHINTVILANLVLGENAVPGIPPGRLHARGPRGRARTRCSPTRRSGGASSMPLRASIA